MSIEFVRLDYDNNPAKNAVLEEHRRVISEYAEKGCRYAGYVPVKFGPSGKTLSIDMIFEKAE